jgi:hypothetical protein
MTGDEKYLRWAERIGDAYLLTDPIKKIRKMVEYRESAEPDSPRHPGFDVFAGVRRGGRGKGVKTLALGDYSAATDDLEALVSLKPDDPLLFGIRQKIADVR